MVGGGARRRRPKDRFRVVRRDHLRGPHPLGGGDGDISEDGMLASRSYSSRMTESPPLSARWGPMLLDIAPALVLGAALAFVPDPGRDAAIATLALVVAPLIFRRRWPLAVLVVVAAGVVVTTGRAGWLDVAAVVLASFTMGDQARERSLSAIGVLLVAAALAGGFLVQTGDPKTSIALPFVILVPSWIIGDFRRGRRAEGVARVAEIERGESERALALQSAITDERRRVARELHDVVAHGVSVMLIQAGAARKVLRTMPDQADTSLLAVEATGREAMSELRTLLGVLADNTDGAGLAPQPGLAQLEALLDRGRQGGRAPGRETEG